MLNRKTAGQPLSYSSFKFEAQHRCCLVDGKVAWKLRRARRARRGLRNHIETVRNRLETGLETGMIYIETGRFF